MSPYVGLWRIVGVFEASRFSAEGVIRRDRH
jgi:hypothetical protein